MTEGADFLNGNGGYPLCCSVHKFPSLLRSCESHSAAKATDLIELGANNVLSRGVYEPPFGANLNACEALIKLACGVELGRNGIGPRPVYIPPKGTELYGQKPIGETREEHTPHKVGDN